MARGADAVFDAWLVWTQGLKDLPEFADRDQSPMPSSCCGQSFKKAAWPNTNSTLHGRIIVTTGNHVLCTAREFSTGEREIHRPVKENCTIFVTAGKTEMVNYQQFYNIWISHLFFTSMEFSILDYRW